MYAMSMRGVESVNPTFDELYCFKCTDAPVLCFGADVYATRAEPFLYTLGRLKECFPVCNTSCSNLECGIECL